MRGTITVIKPFDERAHRGGYGFIMDEEGASRFFNAKDVAGRDFAALHEGDEVEFDPVEDKSPRRKGNGLRAERVSCR